MDSEHQMSTESRASVCIKCKSAGKHSKLKLSYLSLTTGIWLCSNQKCCFPLDSPEVNKYVVKINLLDRSRAKTPLRSRRKISCTGSQRSKRTSKASSVSSKSSIFHQEEEGRSVTNLSDNTSALGADTDSNALYCQDDKLEHSSADYQSTKSECVSLVSSVSSSTLSDGISSRTTPVEWQKPIYLDKWLSKMECDTFVSGDDLSEKDDSNIQNDRFVNLERYLPYVPRHEKLNAEHRFDVDREMEEPFSILESFSVEMAACSGHTQTTPSERHSSMVYDVDSAYSSPLTDFSFDKSEKSELLPVNNFGQSREIGSVMTIIENLFEEADCEGFSFDEDHLGVGNEIDITEFL